MRLFAMLLLCAAIASASFRLYLRDGTWHVVTEYQREGDRVKFYSAERSDWEEIPTALLDLAKTETERKGSEDKRLKEAAEQDAEDKADRELAREISRVPQDPGVYLAPAEGGVLVTIAQAEVAMVTDKKRAILKTISPVPLINGKATMEVTGEVSKNRVTERRPEFYVRQANEERLAIVRMAPKKGVRIVANVLVVAVVKEMVSEHDVVETFRRQFADGLFKIWPTSDLAPGEYAVVQYTEGKADTKAWDFGVN